MAYCTFLRILTITSAYIRLFELTPVKIWVKWTKIGSIIGPNLFAIGPKEPDWMGVPFFDRRDLPLGSRHRFDCYDHPQGISEVTLIPYQHLDGQCGAVQGYNKDLRFWVLSELF